MYLGIIIMSLVGSIASGFFGRILGVSGSQFVTSILVMLTSLAAITAFTEINMYNVCTSFYLLKWLDTESLNVYWGFNIDSLTSSMLIPVLVVSTLVHLYSIGYMSEDPHNQRFFSYLSLFTFMMIILVTSNNYLLMFVGWEGVGICSYLLVSFWFTRIAANQSSISAMLTNRVGDCLLTVGMFAILWTLGNLDYATVFSLSSFINENAITIIGVCLLIGAMAKSSQVGLHVWLPMAMEGPTPVSALIHAATMVTAGVYLLVRSSPLIEYSSTILLISLWIGAITTIFSSLIGLFQQDIKRVIAYSTMSQLGLMVVAVGLSSYNIALYHLINHAFYKALLFLGAGAVIHGVADNQDFRKYGGLKQFLPLSHSVMLIASLSLVAFPYMTGFFSKDLILESCYGGFDKSTITVYYIATIGAMFTTLYSVKTLNLTFTTNPNGPIVNYKNAHEGNVYMSLPLVILALFSIYFGFGSRDMFVGLGSNLFIDNSIFIYPNNEIMINTEFAVPTHYKLLPFIITIFSIAVSLIISGYLIKSLINFKFTRFGYNIFSFFNLRFLVELIYNKYITENVLRLGGQTTRILDKGAVESIGPYGLENALTALSRNLASLSTGVITSYALYILVGALSYMFISYLPAFTSTLLIILLIIAINMINSVTNTETAIKVSDALELEKKAFIEGIEHENTLKTSILEPFIISIKESIRQYWVNFNLLNLTIGIIKLKIATLFLAYIMCLDFIFNNHIFPLNVIFVQDISSMSTIFVILFILFYLLITPLKNKINYSRTVVCNFIIINTMIYSSFTIFALVIYTFDINIADINYTSLSLSIAYLLSINFSEGQIMFMDNNTTSNPSANMTPSNSSIMFMNNDTSNEGSNATLASASNDPTDESSRSSTPVPDKRISMSLEELAEFSNSIIAESYKLDGINKTPPTFKIEKTTVKNGEVSIEQTSSGQTPNQQTSHGQGTEEEIMDADSVVSDTIISEGCSLALYTDTKSSDSESTGKFSNDSKKFTNNK